MLLAIALLLAQSGRWSSGRPPECSSPAASGLENVWERAKAPELRRYCDLLASASSKLSGTTSMAEAALADARAADLLLAGRAAPRVFEGRALAALGRFDQAAAAIEAAGSTDATVFDDPRTLLTWARVLARTGRLREAARAYGTLLPRASALALPEAAAASAEAGLVALACGRASLDDAVGALRESLRTNVADIAPVAVLGLALALERRGDTDGARALLADRSSGDPRVVLASRPAADVLAVAPVEALALTAVGLEAVDRRAARETWAKYLAAGPDASWVDSARARMGSAR